MQYILSLSGCTPPLEEVIKLWDYLFGWLYSFIFFLLIFFASLAFGIHLNIPIVVAQLMLNRQEYLSQKKGINLR